MRKPTTILTILALTLALFGGAQAEHLEQPVDASPHGDANGWLVAVSGTGNATCDAVLCAAAAGGGNASAEGCNFMSCGRGVAVSGFGNASGSVAASAGGAAECTGFYSPCVAVAAFGNASCRGYFVPCVAVSATGTADADGGVAVDRCPDNMACTQAVAPGLLP